MLIDSTVQKKPSSFVFNDLAFEVAGAAGGEFFRLPFQKDEDFCDFFHFNFPKTSKFISRRINRFKTDFYQYNHVLLRL